MFFGSKKRHETHGGVSHPSDPARDEAGPQQSQQWQAWRRSAQTVTRVWYEWLAANRCERAELYGRYLSALAEEERAATELQRTLLGASAQHSSDCALSVARGR